MTGAGMEVPCASSGSEGGEAAAPGSVSAPARGSVGPPGGPWVPMMSEEQGRAHHEQAGAGLGV